MYESLITVGRLDEETTGFLLVTTDGKMVHKITNPNNNIKKTYYIEAMELITKKQIDSIKMGVRIIISDHDETQKYTTRPAIVDDITDYTIKLTIDEGKKREIRRMFHSIGNEVDTIHRISTENMQLSNYNLEIGDFCKVTIQEINELIFD